MSAIEIEFAPKTPALIWLRSGVAFSILSFASLFLILGLCVYEGMLSSANDALSEENAQLLQQANALQVDKKRSEKNIKPGANTQALEAVVSQLNLPWGELLQAFDSRSSRQVALLEFSPDASTHIIKLVAEARNSAQMTSYIESLKKLDVIDDIKLTHHEVNTSDPLLPIRFELEAYWVGAFPK